MGRGSTGAVGAVGGVPGQPGAAGAGARGVTLPGGAAGVAGPGGVQGPPPIFKEEVRIVADEVTNSLVILATKRDYQLIVDVLRKIDVVPRQVVLEVSIAEIGLTKDFEFGIRYALAEGNLRTSVPDPNAIVDTSSIFRNGPPGQPVGGLLGDAIRVPLTGAFAVISDRDHFQIFINTLATRTNVKMLSAPYIIAADNREAHILVGESIPILTSTQTSVISTSNIVNSVQYRDTGKILTVLPQVNSKGLVNMQIRQEVSDVGQPSFGNTNSPSFRTREAETTVVVQDGESVLIGGIIDDLITHTRSGIPYLMDIPTLGVLFRSESDSVRRTELLILITPYVIRNREEARDVTETFDARQRGLRLYTLKQRQQKPRRLTPVEEPLPPGRESRPRDVVSPEAAP
jgi:general secretion pathway protein D